MSRKALLAFPFLLAACFSVETRLVRAGTYLPLGITSNEDLVTCDTASGELRVVPGPAHDTETVLATGVACETIAAELVIQGPVVAWSVEDDEGSPTLHVWSAKTGPITLLQSNDTASTRRLSVSHDGKWLFTTEPNADNALLHQLVAYALDAPNPTGRVISDLVESSCGTRAYALPAPSTKVLLQGCPQGEESVVLVSHDWSADFAKATFATGLVRPTAAAPFGTSDDGRFLFFSGPDGALLRANIADATVVTLGTGVRAHTASADGTAVIFRTGDGAVSHWTEAGGAKKLLDGVELLGRGNAELTHVLVSTAHEDHDGGAWKTTSVLLVEIATGKRLELAGQAGGSISSARFSPDGKTAFYVENLQALGTGTLFAQRLGADAPFQVADAVAGWSFTESGTLLVDAEHVGTTLYGADSRYTILALPPGYDGTPTRVAERTVAGKLQYGESNRVFYAVDGGGEATGLYVATVP